MDDDLIITYITRRKEKGLELLIDSYAGLVTSIIKKHLGSLQNYVEECVNDVLLAVWNNISRFDKSKNSFKNWVAAIAKYKAIDYKRKYASGMMEQSLVEIEESVQLNKNTIQNEIKAEVDELLHHLNEDDRELFEKYYLEGVQLEDIAKRKKVSISNLYNRLSRGRRKLKNFSNNRTEGGV
ncbi:sigma-70 family RNA polymerase sigma factor [Bacillus massiliigorillae]|uniref:sigma-70 family RNA polymerase sigma factor n=1 Tax=Bacillus massiliigorillae TaxID=1243664 RepID=UPI0003A1164B|nr:sigma-70 family RNA polymerase sigma factor [Bacillus massiliigorillae]